MKVIFLTFAIHLLIMKPQILFVEVLLPLPVRGTYTYRVPASAMNSVLEGIRVAVQFGRKKIYTGLVVDIHDRIPQNFQPKYILSVVDETPIVNQTQLQFWKWLATYYMALEGEVMNAALPSALKLAGETQIVLHPEAKEHEQHLNEKEFLIADALGIQDTLTLTEAANIVEQKKIMPLIKNLIEKKVVLLKEELDDTYKPKTVKYVALRDEYRDEKKMGSLFDELEKRAYKQLEILMSYIKISGYYSDNAKSAIKKSVLLNAAKATDAPLKALVEKEILKVFEQKESRFRKYSSEANASDILFTKEQNFSLEKIRDFFSDNKTVLLHGVTGSGKTEIYIKLIQEVLDKGKQVLYLLPEIALTTQIIERLRRFFGDQVGVYHSKHNPQERVEIWNEVLKQSTSESKKYQVIIGARSAVFLPFDNLGLVVVDEEHDSSYKQKDPAPRYNGRDAAIYLARMHGANVLLGTATPSLESYFHADHKKFGLVDLKERFGGLELPEILISDLRIEKKRKQMTSMFSSLLMKHMQEAFENNEQVILFQNRRGFSLRVECEVCAWVPECKNCDVTMIYHKKSNLLKCHYCGYSEPVPERCPACGSHDIFMHGFGTEQVEEELALVFPKLRVKRMDLDTTRTKHGHQKIINEFSDRKIDILVGTQMVTKGLDFESVRVVGILNADAFLTFPDFRSFERGFQLMAQVSGRAGRKHNRGKVIIQTHNPHHPAIQQVINNDYPAMYKNQIEERRKFLYPPFYRIVKIEMKHKEWQTLNKGAEQLGKMLRTQFGKAVLGPEYPIIPRIRNFFIKNILIKIRSDKQLQQNKTAIQQSIDKFKDGSSYKAIRVNTNVDPM
ncbi:MAG TPA: primosomal protein N' [Bacteroidales bacterium]|nr:primosomal protein N' [Bacteroidales bacterium]